MSISPLFLDFIGPLSVPFFMKKWFPKSTIGDFFESPEKTLNTVIGLIEALSWLDFVVGSSIQTFRITQKGWRYPLEALSGVELKTTFGEI